MVRYNDSFPKPGGESAPFGRAVGSFDPAEGDCKGRKSSRRRQRASSKEERKPTMAAFDKVVQLLSQRDRSQRELQARLSQAGYGDEEIRDAMERALRCGLVDDTRFADSFVRGKTAMGKGRQAIARELREKHGLVLGNDGSLCPVDATDGLLEPASIGEDCLDLLNDEAQLSAAIGELTRKPPRAKDAWGSAYQRLLRRGYPPPIASRAARTWLENSGR